MKMRKFLAVGLLASAAMTSLAAPTDDCARALRWCQSRLQTLHRSLDRAYADGDYERADFILEKLYEAQQACGERITRACEGST